jgi:hypothetical protein
MTHTVHKATEAQVSVAAEIEKALAVHVAAAQNVDLRFLVYLMEMALDEAASIAGGRFDGTESATTLHARAVKS